MNTADVVRRGELRNRADLVKITAIPSNALLCVLVDAYLASCKSQSELKTE